jgi:hypothetical protein
MHKILLTFLLTGILQDAWTQKNGEPGSAEVDLPMISYDKKIPFGRVEIIDCRYDTSKIGFLPKGRSFKKLVVSPGLSKNVETVLNLSLKKNLDPSSSSTLVIVVKTLWLKLYLASKDKPSEAESTTLYNDLECMAKLELYAKTDSNYYPLFRIDSSFRSQTDIPKARGAAVMVPFEKCLSQLATVPIENLSAFKKLSWTDVEQFNKKRFEKPILLTDHLQKGIYLTFKDFVENKATQKEFEVHFGKSSDQLYVTENGERKLFTEFWGFCDGEKLYANGRLEFYELLRVQNSFEITVVFKNTHGGSVTPATLNAGDVSSVSILSGMTYYGLGKLFGAVTPKGEKIPFQINMDTGKIY